MFAATIDDISCKAWPQQGLVTKCFKWPQIRITGRGNRAAGGPLEGPLPCAGWWPGSHLEIILSEGPNAAWNRTWSLCFSSQQSPASSFSCFFYWRSFLRFTVCSWIFCIFSLFLFITVLARFFLDALGFFCILFLLIAHISTHFMRESVVGWGGNCEGRLVSFKKINEIVFWF